MNFYRKKGVSVVSVLIIVVILAVLTSTATISVNYIVNNTYRNEYNREYKLVKAATEDYLIRNSGIVDFIEIDFDISEIDTLDLEQFSEETVVGNVIEVYIIDLEKIGVYDTTYGNDTSEGDIYILTKDKKNVYYKKGFVDNGDVYYKDIED